MKKVIFLGLLIVSGILVQAQLPNSGFLLKGGVNFSTIKNDFENAKFNRLTGYYGGIGLHLPMAMNLLALQVEGIYSQEGAQYKDATEKMTANFTYINVPAVLQLKTPFGLYVEGGGQYSFLLDAKQKSEFTDGTKSDENIKSKLKDQSISWIAGVGFKTLVGIEVNARYVSGITNLNKEGNDKTTSNTISVGVSMNF